MNVDRYLNIILAPVVTEKSARVGEAGQYVFKVAKDASKPEIKKAIEHLFKVTVKSVRTSNVKPKEKRTGRRMGTRSGWKKAFVALSEGHDIDFAATSKE